MRDIKSELLGMSKPQKRVYLRVLGQEVMQYRSELRDEIWKDDDRARGYD